MSAAVVHDLSHWAECALAWRQPRCASRLYPVLIGSEGAVSSITGTSWDAAKVHAGQLRLAQDGAYLFPNAAEAAVVRAADAVVVRAADAVVLSVARGAVANAICGAAASAGPSAEAAS